MRYTITVTETPVCIAHKLQLPYESKCNCLHGHNYSVEAVIYATQLNTNGMVVDFTHVKSVIKKYDHAFLGDATCYKGTVEPEKYFPHVEPSTAENFALVLFNEISEVIHSLNPTAGMVSVSVWETPSSKVTVTGS